MAQYTVRHVTRFRYSVPIVESVTEARMQPRSTDLQQCSLFRLHVRPATSIHTYTDHLGNVVHHFSLPGVHRELNILAESEVQVHAPPPLPASLPANGWDAVDTLLANSDCWDMLVPSTMTPNTTRLAELAAELDVRRRSDPLNLLLEINAGLHRSFAYDAKSTRVESPIDDALQHRRGVCQDFSHIMLALVRNYLQIPCRYVSGYLYHRRDDRSVDGASHAWLEVLLPELGWIGFDPTNNILAGDRHIQVAVGRDYHDVPPTRGVFKGNAGSELAVTVRVRSITDPEYVSSEDDEIITPPYIATEQELQTRYAQMILAMQIQQQQQQ